VINFYDKNYYAKSVADAKGLSEMLEVILIVSLINACLNMPLRGKTIATLSDGQRQRMQRLHEKYMMSSKGRSRPMTAEEFLKSQQRQGLGWLITFLVLLPIYVGVMFLFIMFVFPYMF